MSTETTIPRTATQTVAEFAADLTWDAIPEVVVTKLKTTLLHDIAMAIAGHSLGGTVIALAKAAGTPAAANAPRLIVDGTPVTADYAILANAMMMHARTQDDTHLPTSTHLGSTTLPALLAIGEELDASGRQLLVAMLAAYETSALAEGVSDAATDRGFRPSTVVGPLAAAVGVSKLLGLSAEQTTNSLGLAAGFGAGTGQTWVSGTEEWQYQLGVAGQHGVLAARLAALGVTAATDALEGSSGLYRAVAGIAQPAGAHPHRLGSHWESLEVTYKPYPVCVINQRPVAMMSSMVTRLGLSPKDVNEVVIRLPPSHAEYPGTRSYAPFAGVGAALMSAPHCLALALRDGTVTRASLEQFGDVQVRAIAEKVTVVSDPTLSPGDCHITVRSGASATRVATSDDVPVPASFAWDARETLDRVLALEAEMPIDSARIQALADTIFDLENLSVRDLVSATIA